MSESLPSEQGQEEAIGRRQKKKDDAKTGHRISKDISSELTKEAN